MIFSVPVKMRRVRLRRGSLTFTPSSFGELADSYNPERPPKKSGPSEESDNTRTAPAALGARLEPSG